MRSADCPSPGAVFVEGPAAGIMIGAAAIPQCWHDRSRDQPKDSVGPPVDVASTSPMVRLTNKSGFPDAMARAEFRSIRRFGAGASSSACAYGQCHRRFHRWLRASVVGAGPRGGDGGSRIVGGVLGSASNLLLPVVFPLVMAKPIDCGIHVAATQDHPVQRRAHGAGQSSTAATRLFFAAAAIWGLSDLTSGFDAWRLGEAAAFATAFLAGLVMGLAGWVVDAGVADFAEGAGSGSAWEFDGGSLTTVHRRLLRARGNDRADHVHGFDCHPRYVRGVRRVEPSGKGADRQRHDAVAEHPEAHRPIGTAPLVECGLWRPAQMIARRPSRRRGLLPGAHHSAFQPPSGGRCADALQC